MLNYLDPYLFQRFWSAKILLKLTLKSDMSSEKSFQFHVAILYASHVPFVITYDGKLLSRS